MLDNLPWKTAGEDPEENTKWRGKLTEIITQGGNEQAQHL